MLWTPLQSGWAISANRRAFSHALQPVGRSAARQPALIVTMGAIVLVIMLAVLMPIIQLNTWVR